MDIGLTIIATIIWVVSSYIYSEWFNWKYDWDPAKAVGLGLLTVALFGAMIG